MIDLPVVTPEQLHPFGQGRTLTDMGILELLPPVPAGDASLRAVAKAVDAELRLIDELIPKVLIWSMLGQMREPLLTHLALWLHADYWDEDWSLEAKRAFLFRQIALHRKKGTCWAVEEAVGLVYGPAYLREWFEYGGEPGWFRLEVGVTGGGLTEFEISKIEQMVEVYKRKSQHLEGISFSVGAPCTIYFGAACLADEVLTVYPYYPEEINQAAAKTYPAAGQDLLEVISVFQN